MSLIFNYHFICLILHTCWCNVHLSVFCVMCDVWCVPVVHDSINMHIITILDERGSVSAVIWGKLSKKFVYKSCFYKWNNPYYIWRFLIHDHPIICGAWIWNFLKVWNKIKRDKSYSLGWVRIVLILYKTGSKPIYQSLCLQELEQNILILN